MTLTTWMGRPVDELSREELLEIISFLGDQLEAERRNHLGNIRMMQLLARRNAEHRG